MSTVEKVVLRFDERVFPDGLRRVTHVSPTRRYPAIVDLTDHAGAPTIVAFHNPRAAVDGHDRALDHKKGVMDTLVSMFGPVSDPIAAHVTSWADDPHSFGSYSYIPVGGSAGDMRTLADAGSDRLYFAGEHTVPEHFGTVHAAYTSGLRAAAEVGRPR
jgi:monoamine oxidase